MKKIISGIYFSFVFILLIFPCNRPVYAAESLMLHCSMGAAMYPHDGDSVFTLLEAADSAMYMVKKSGKDNIVFSWDIC